MAKKGYRGPKKVSKNKLRTITNTTSKAWPDLPHQLIRMISKQVQVLWQNHGLGRQEGGLLHSVSFDGVAKTWRSASRQCCNKQQLPWLDLVSTQESLDITHYVYSIPETLWSNGWWCRRYKRMTNEDSIISCSHGELLMKSLTNKVEDSYYYLWSPPGSSTWLPQFPEGVSFGQIVLSSSPDYGSSNCTVLVLTRGSRAGFMFCKINRTNRRWIEEECTLLDPNSSQSNPCTIQFTNVVALDGKFYALSLQGTLAVIDTDSIDPAPRVTILCAKRAIPSTWSRSFKEYLVESCGEILLVFLISMKTIGIVDVEVLRLNFHTRSWERMVSLGDRTFFVRSNCFMAVCSSELGCRANCVYFTQAMKHGWWVFDLEGGTISEGWNGNSTDKSPMWDVPIAEQMDMIL